MTRPFSRRRAWACAAGLVASGCTGGTSPADAEPPVLNEALAGPIFPADNWWNLDVSGAPLDPRSSALIDWICDRAAPTDPCDAMLHPDFGPPPYGIPYMGVSGDQPLEPVTFVLYGSQSDAGAPGRSAGYPLPHSARTEAGWIEGGVAGGGASGDRHLLVVDRDRRLLFELWATRWTGSGWQAGSGAVFDLDTNDRRPDGWTSADAAGLAILPGLVKVHEVESSNPIQHAFRVTVRDTDSYVWPASHAAGSNPDAPPMGTRLRLKASVDTSGYPPAMRRIFVAMQTYGLIVADNGSDMYVQGTMDASWDNGVLNPAFHSLQADDFEVIELGWQP
ncbi:MAG: hypothetical protein ABL963_12895 [Longimicrobiales bacterium]